MKKCIILLGVLLTFSLQGTKAEKNRSSMASFFYQTSIYYQNSTPGNLYISLYHVATGRNIGSYNVAPGSGFLASVEEGTYHVYMGGNGGTYTFKVNALTGTGTGKSFHNVYLSGSNTFRAY